MAGENHLEWLSERERLKNNRFPSVQTVLVVLSADAMVFGRDSLHYKIFSVYPESSITFWNTSGKPMGKGVVNQFDLAIDFTGPGQRQGLFFARKVRKVAKYCVGRNAGLFRKRIYDRVFDEKNPAIRSHLSQDVLERERFAEKEVLALAGVPLIPAAGVTADRSKTIAFDMAGH